MADIRCYDIRYDKNFRWLFFTRFMMQQGVSTVFTFVQYWVSDMVYIPNCWSKEKAVAILMIPLVISAAICSVLFGLLSDRIKRRKPLVISALDLWLQFALTYGCDFISSNCPQTSNKKCIPIMGSNGNAVMIVLLMSALHTFIIEAILMSLSAGCFTVIRGGNLSYYITLALLFVSGIGYGTYLSVDFALLLDILPSIHNKAKDIAVWNQALILPQVLATPIGGFILDFFEQFNCELGLGYIILFAITAAYFFISGIFVVKMDVP